MAIKYKLRDIPQIAGREVFFDANILIYLFWPTGKYASENLYAKAFSKLLRQGNPLSIDFNVISEIVNRVIRIEHQKNAPQLSFKQFRNSIDGKDALQDLYTIIDQNILPYFTITEKSYSQAEIQTFLKVDSLDFSDKGIVSICSENAYILLTNDKDFKDAGIDILTANRNIV